MYTFPPKVTAALVICGFIFTGIDRKDAPPASALEAYPSYQEAYVAGLTARHYCGLYHSLFSEDYATCVEAAEQEYKILSSQE